MKTRKDAFSFFLASRFLFFFLASTITFFIVKGIWRRPGDRGYHNVVLYTQSIQHSMKYNVIGCNNNKLFINYNGPLQYLDIQYM